MSQPSLRASFAGLLAAKGRLVLAAVAGVGLTLLHSAMIDLPRADVIDALDSDRYRFQWIVGSYLLGGACGMALTGFGGALFGLKRTYLGGLILFSVAAFLGGTVSQVPLLAPLRLVQGFGMGLTICAAMVILWRELPEQKALAMALYGMGVYLAALIGAPLGGFLTYGLSWRWMFFLNLPLGLAVVALAGRFLPPDRPAERGPVHFDLVGLALLVAWIVPLNVVLDMGQYWGWTNSPFFVPWMAGFLAAFTAFVGWGTLAARPLIDLRPFGRRNFALGMAIKAVFSVNLYVLVGLLSAYMIDLRGYQWWQGGLVILPACLTMAASLLAGVRWGTDGNRKARMVAGLVVMAAVTWQLGVLDLYTSKFWLAGMMAVWGAGAGLVIGPALLTIFEGETPAETTRSAGVFNILRSIPAYVVGTILVTQLTRTTDAYLDRQRQAITHNRPAVAETRRDLATHFVGRGSGLPARHQQAHVTLGGWVRANARGWAFGTVLRWLALVTAAGPVLVLFIRAPSDTLDTQ